MACIYRGLLLLLQLCLNWLLLCVLQVYKLTGETGSYRYMAPEVFRCGLDAALEHSSKSCSR